MQILQLSTVLPNKKYSTEKLLQEFPCQLPEGVRQNILNLGVSNRHLANQPSFTLSEDNLPSEESLVELCQQVSEKAIQEAGLTVGDIDYLITTYDANPLLSPGLSYLLVPRIRFDRYIRHVNAHGVASTAFPKALQLAEDYLALHPNGKVLICISGVSSFWFQNQVHGMKEALEINQINQIENKARKQRELQKWVATMQFFLFGDGVAAAIVTNSDRGLTVKRIAEVTNLKKEHYTAGYSRLLQSDEPFRFGFQSHLDREIPKLGAEYTDLALKKLLGTDAAKIVKSTKKWAIHTGSEKILNLLADHQGIDHEKLEESLYVLREYGNLAGASLPFILHQVIDHTKFSNGDVVLMVGYGWGFCAAACMLEFVE